MKKLFKILLLVAAVGVGICLVGASFGGKVDPRVWSWPGVLTLTLTFWGVALAVITLLAAVTRSWSTLVVCVLAWVCSYSGVKAVSPFNAQLDASADAEIFSLLTYNVYSLRVYDDETVEGYNPTVAAILASGASVAALQECPSLDKAIPSLGYVDAQVDSLKAVYPYRRFNSDGMAILSRYPVSPIKIKEKPTGTAQFAGWKINVDGDQVDVYSVHLQSFGFDSNDKQVYRQLTDGDLKHNMSEVRHELLPKVTHAMRCHADEGEMIQRIISADTCRRVILCGDFNDVPGSYVVNQLQKQCSLKGAWAQGGFGPPWTYRSNRFYFHIDQILYRGMDRPLWTRRLRTGGSDHFPLQTAFQL